MRVIDRIWKSPVVRDITRRVVNTFAQALGAIILLAGPVGTIGLGAVSWGPALSVAGLAALLCLIQHVANATANNESLKWD